MNYCGYYYARPVDVENPPLAADFNVMSQLGANVVWLRHSNAQQAGEASRLAASYGMRIVAAIGELNASTPSEYWKLEEREWRKTLPRVLGEYGSAPLPLAWCLGDEPPPDYEVSLKYGSYIHGWKEISGGLRSCLVCVPAATTWYAPDDMCCDYYCFRKDWTWATIRSQYLSALALPVPWTMGQLHGNPEYGLRFPSPQEAAWQVYCAAIYGKEAYFAFAANVPPYGTYPSEELQGATGAAFTRVRRWPLVSQEWKRDTSNGIVRATNGRYTLAVADPTSAPSTLRLPGWRVRSVESGKSYYGLGSVSVRLSPGEAIWLERLV